MLKPTIENCVKVAGLVFCATFLPSSLHALAGQVGSVMEWGWQVMPVVEDKAHFATIAAGGGHNLAIQVNGVVTVWGDNSYRQSKPPPGLDSVVAVAAGHWHSLVLKSNGTVVT